MCRCKGCDSRVKLIKAHLIPEAFVRATDDGSGASLEIADRTDRFPKRRPIGHYDSKILCLECEKKLDIIDDYGFKTLSQRLGDLVAIIDGEKTLCYQLAGVDTQLLKRFLVSVLWRMSVSSIDFANMIKLESLENKAKEITFGSESSEIDFPYFMSIFPRDPRTAVMLNPHGQQYCGKLFSKLFFPYIQAWHLVDEGGMPKELDALQAGNNDELLFLARDFHGSSEMSLIHSMVEKSKKRKR